MHEEIRVLRRRATLRPLRNRRPRRDNVRRDGRSLRLGWQQTIVLLWLAVTIAVVAVALVLSRGRSDGPCPEAWGAAACTWQALAHSPRPTAHNTAAGQVLLTDAIIWPTPARRTAHDGRGDPNRPGRGQGPRRAALPDLALRAVPGGPGATAAALREGADRHPRRRGDTPRLGSCTDTAAQSGSAPGGCSSRSASLLPRVPAMPDTRARPRPRRSPASSPSHRRPSRPEPVEPSACDLEHLEIPRWISSSPQGTADGARSSGQRRAGPVRRI